MQVEVFGILLWGASLFVPGLSLGELLDLWEGQPLLMRVADAFGLSLCLDVAGAVLFCAVDAFGLGWRYLYLLLVFSLAPLLFSVIRRDGFRFPRRPEMGRSKGVALAFGATLAILALFFAKYPLFPPFPSVDFGAHVRDMATMAVASPSPSQGLLYYALYFVLTPLVAVGGAPALFLAQYGMASLTLLSVLLVWQCARLVYDDGDVAMWAALVYGLTGTAWFFPVFDVGLWSNFFGLLLSLILVSSTVRFFSKFRTLPVLVLASLAFYFGHYSALLLLPSLILFAALHLRGELRRSLSYLGVVLGPAAAGLLAFPQMLGTLLGFAGDATTGNPPPPTWLSWLFLGPSIRQATAHQAGLPALSLPFASLSYLLSSFYDDPQALLYLVLLVPGLVLLLRCKERRPLLLMPAWLATTLAVAPQSIAAWRFSVVALVPFTFLAAFGLWSLILLFAPRLMAASRSKLSSLPRLRPSAKGWAVLAAFTWLLVLPVPGTLGSWGSVAAGSSMANSSLTAANQQDIYAAIMWMKSNMPPGVGASSVADSTFSSYSQLLGGPRVYYVPTAGGTCPSTCVAWASPSQSSLFAASVNTPYLIVTRYISEPSVPANNLTTVVGDNATIVDLKASQLEAQYNASARYGTVGAFPLEFNGTAYSRTVAVFFPPWTTYDGVTMPLSNVVYRNPDVIIWCIATSCRS